MSGLPDRSLPALFRSADKQSLKAQKQYKKLLLITFILTIAGCVASSSSSIFTHFQKGYGFLAAASLMVTVMISYAIRAVRPEKEWYLGRAIAESVRTRAWRYAVCSEPYNERLAEEDADQLFIAELYALIKESNCTASTWCEIEGGASQITPAMKRLRQSEWTERLQTYVNYRLKVQRDWYETKALQSEDAEKHVFWTIFSLQVIATIVAFAATSFDIRLAIVVPILTTLVAVVFGWLQVRRHQEIAQAYSIAATDLRMATEQSKSISSAEMFSTFVSDAENAISREHTMWLARRDIRAV